MSLNNYHIPKEIIPLDAKPHEHRIVKTINDIGADFTSLVGSTEDEKKASFSIMGLLRELYDAITKWLKSKRFGVLGFSVCGFCILKILNALGVPTEQFWPHVLKVAEWMAAHGIL